MKKPGKIITQVDEPCPEGTIKGPGQTIKWSKSESGVLMIFLQLKKKYGIAGSWEVVVVTDPTPVNDQPALGYIQFTATYTKSFKGKQGPCLKKETSCDPPPPWPAYV